MRISTTSVKDVQLAIPARNLNAHKGDFGRLLIIGGSSRYVGAPALAALSALRSGVDLAVVAAPEKVAWAINSFSPDLITIKLPCEELEPSVSSLLKDELTKATALVIGPGLSSSPKVLSAARKIAEILKGEFPSLPAVFDADALKPFAGFNRYLGMPWVLTPHAGEFRQLTGRDLPASIQEKTKVVAAFSQRLGITTLLKGHEDIIASPDGEIKINRTGNPGMTVGGTGDVLAGVVGAFLAQKNSPFAAAAAGAWVCGKAGDLCLKEMGYEFTASDVINRL
ncbi:MAG: NAD(P)H-hydrate dehydratase, partial [Candidatus Hadarchaeales archaeon]